MRIRAGQGTRVAVAVAIATGALAALPAAAAAPDREVVTSYDYLDQPAFKSGTFQRVSQGFEAQSNTITHLATVVGDGNPNDQFQPGDGELTLSLCDAPPPADYTQPCAHYLASAQSQYHYDTVTQVDIGDVPVTKGDAYWMVVDAPVVGGDRKVRAAASPPPLYAYWTQGGDTADTGYFFRMRVRGYNRTSDGTGGNGGKGGNGGSGGPVPATKLTAAFHTSGKHKAAKLNSLTALSTLTGSKLRLRCLKRCKPKHFSKTTTARGDTATVKTKGKLRFKRKSVLRLDITKPGMLGRFVKFRIRLSNGQIDRLAEGCTADGSSAETGCSQ